MTPFHKAKLHTFHLQKKEREDKGSDRKTIYSLRSHQYWSQVNFLTEIPINLENHFSATILCKNFD